MPRIQTTNVPQDFDVQVQVTRNVKAVDDEGVPGGFRKGDTISEVNHVTVQVRNGEANPPADVWAEMQRNNQHLSWGLVAVK